MMSRDSCRKIAGVCSANRNLEGATIKARFPPGALMGAIGLALAPALQACPACGDKFGVPFERIHSGHSAGQIILFARPDSGLRSLNRQSGLSRRLERSGHTVHVIDNDKDLDGAIHANRTDLVLAEPADATALRSRLSGDTAAPLVLSLVAVDSAAAESDVEASSCLLQAAAKQGTDVVQSIERFISNRQAGQVIACTATHGPR